MLKSGLSNEVEMEKFTYSEMLKFDALIQNKGW